MTKTKPSTKILQAMEVIGSPERWTKDTFARDSDDEPTTINAKDAVCFCSVGALEKVKADIYAKSYVDKASSNISGSIVIDFNDDKQTKHKDVMNMFMTAAFLAMSEGK